MSVWTNTITNKGLEMLNGALTGGTIRISKAVSGSNSVALTELMQQVTMAGQEQTLSIQPVRTGDDGTLEIPVVLTNMEITEAYNLSQIGLFANHPEEGEILFALAQIDEKKKVPTNAESPGYTIEFYFKFKLTNATNITIETPGPYATLETVERMIGDITAQDVGALPDNGGYAIFTGSASEAKIEARNDPESEENRRVLRVKNPLGSADAKTALVFEDVLEGVRKSYNIYGEHNPPTASDVGAVPVDRFGTYLTSSIVEKAKTLKEGIYHFALGGSDYNGDDLPDSGYVFSNAEVIVRSEGYHFDITLFGTNVRPPAIGRYISNVWYGWSTEFLPLEGGTLRGGIKISGENYANITLEDNVANTLSTIEHYSKVFMVTLQEKGNTDPSQIVKFQMNCNPAEPLSNKLRFINDNTFYRLFGEHNKPTGAYYRGTGDATKRTIDIGGIGELLWIKSANTLTFVWDFGGVTIDKSAKAITYHKMSELCFEYGVLTIATTSEAVNSASNVHYYGYVG